MLKQKGLFRPGRALSCVAVCLSLIFNFTNLDAQTRRSRAAVQGGGGPVVATTLTDSFDDSDNDGRAPAGAEVTYTATITNNGSAPATNVSFTNSLDANSTPVAGSVQVQPDLIPSVARCQFSTASSGSGDCTLSSIAYGQTDINNFTILGGQGSRFNVTASNVGYNPGTGVFAFDATVQNLIAQALGSVDNVTLEPTGVRLFLYKATVTSGTGSVGFSNANGTGTFTAPNQPYFQYNEILSENEVSAAKNLQLNVPNTVGSFTLDFLVSTKITPKLVVNEVLANPGGTVADANGEWFELYNAGLFPVNMEGFKIGDSAASGDRPPHIIFGIFIIEPGAYKVFGQTANPMINNGGVPVDYAYGGSLALANGGPDAVIIMSPYHIHPPDLPPGNIIELDRANYPLGTTISTQNGISRELKNPALDNSNIDDSNWEFASASTVYGPGGRGTPGYQNAAYTPLAPVAEKTPEVNYNPAQQNNLVDTVSVNVGTITPGGTATVTYRVTIADPMPAGVTEISNQGTVAGDNFATVVSDDPLTPAADDATVTPLELAPTAAHVFVAGRVLNGKSGIARAIVLLVDSQGIMRTVRTNSFGYFRFDDVAAGQIYIFNATAKGYSFAPQVVSVSDDIAELNFTAIE